MIKILSLLNLAGVFLFNLLFIADITVVQDAPTTMAPGSEVKVTVTVTKGQLAGFAKLQIDLPPGLSASAIETKGASFTFAEGKAKFIWMALPSQPEFKVSYTLSASSSATGSLPVTGKFSYIEDNERKTKDLVASTITLTGGVVAQDAQMPSAPLPVVNNNDAAVAPVTSTPEPVASAPVEQTPTNVITSRTITPINSTDLQVEVSISKGALRGFGKLQETIPAGFTALEKNSDEAIFTAQDRIAKFVWLNLPAKNDLKVVYQLRSNGQPAGDYSVSGEFGYLLNDQTQKAAIANTAFRLAGTTTATVAVVPPVKVVEPPVTTAQHTEAPQPKETVTAQSTPRTKVPSPETGVTYKVQISAAHREVGAQYFAERHHYTGEFSVERHEGWIKYVTGRFDNYRGARDQRQSYLSGDYNFPGPFVTAYNNGERITVQEALMISNQRSAQ